MLQRLCRAANPQEGQVVRIRPSFATDLEDMLLRAGAVAFAMILVIGLAGAVAAWGQPPAEFGGARAASARV